MIPILGIALLLASAVSGDEHDFNLFDRHCVGKLNGYKYQSPHDCSEFFTCMNEGAWMDMCPEGLYFDEKLQDCEEPKNVVCHQIQAFPACTSQMAGKVIEHDDCTKFYICNGHIWKTGQCEDGLSFVKDQGACQWLQNEQCPEAIFRRQLALSETNVQPFETNHMDSRCTQMDTQVAQHLPHPTSCTKFFKCYLGEAFLEHCPSGLHFSVALDRCEDIEVAQCQVDRWSHNLMQENEKKQNHKGKPHVSQTAAGSQYRPVAEEKIPLMSVALPPNVKQSVERPKEVADHYTHKPVFGTEDALEEYMNNFFSFLNSPNQLMDNLRPTKVNPIEEEKVIEELPIGEEPWMPLQPVMVLPPIPENVVQNFELPLYKPIDVVSVEPVPLQTGPVQTVDLGTPAQILPVLPIRPIKPDRTNERPKKPKHPSMPGQPINPVQVLPEQPVRTQENPGIWGQPINPVQALPVQPVDPVQILPEHPVIPQENLGVLGQPINPAQPVQTMPEQQVNPVQILPEQPTNSNSPMHPIHTNERPKKQKKPGMPKYENFKSEQEYFDSLYEYYYPSHSKPAGFSGLQPDQQWQPVIWQAPKQQHFRQPQRKPQRQLQYQRHRQQQRPIRYRGAAATPDILGEGIPDGRCPWKDDPAQPIHLTHPYDSTKFYKCFLGSVYEHNCPEGLEWSADLNQCDHATKVDQPIIRIEAAQAELDEYEAGIPDRRCPRIEGKDVVHFEHPSECNKFYKCSFGLAYLINCPPGLHWARQLNRCDFKHVALCPYRYQL